MVGEDNFLPAVAPVDRKAGILLIAPLDDAAAHEVRHCLGSGGTEWVLCRLGWLEQHLRMAIAIQLSCCISRRANVIVLSEVLCGDGLDRVSPIDLALDHILLCQVS